MELSIVMVIIALIVAAIFGSSKLQDKAKLQAVIVEIKNIQSAVYNFQTTYKDLPGDMKDAYNYWDSKDCGFAANVNGTRQERCNGDGNQQMGWDGQSGHCLEMHNFWNHLHFADLLPAVHLDCYAYYESRKLKGLTIAPFYLNLTSSPEFGRSANVYRIGAQIQSELDSNPNHTFKSYGKFFTPRQGKAIDEKIDDGIAYSGLLQAANGYDQAGTQGSGCSFDTLNTTNSTDYILTNTTKECYLMLPIEIAH